MVDAVLDAVVEVLKAAGISAFREFPRRFGEKGESLVTVGAQGFKLLGSGLGDYLGLRAHEDGSSVEVFGKRLEIEIAFGVFASFALADGAGECLRICDELMRILGTDDRGRSSLQGDVASPFVQGGVKILELSCGAVSGDEELACFKSECVARCLAFFVAESSGEDGEFLDFVLKGVATYGN